MSKTMTPHRRPGYELKQLPNGDWLWTCEEINCEGRHPDRMSAEKDAVRTIELVESRQ